MGQDPNTESYTHSHREETMYVVCIPQEEPTLHALHGAQPKDAHTIVKRLSRRRVQRQTSEHSLTLRADDLEMVVRRREGVGKLEAVHYISTVVTETCTILTDRSAQ